MVTSLVKTAQDAGAEVEESVCLYEKVPYRFRENPEMAFLESELFRYSRRQYKKKKEESETCSGAISLHETKNPREEARYVAESIRKLVREKDYRYRDIAVIAADLNLYADALEKACELFEIPVFMDHKKKVFCSIHL